MLKLAAMGRLPEWTNSSKGKKSVWMRREAAYEKRFQSFWLGFEPPVAGLVFHARLSGRGAHLLSWSRARGRAGIYREDDGGAGQLAGRIHRWNDESGYGSYREEARRTRHTRLYTQRHHGRQVGRICLFEGYGSQGTGHKSLVRSASYARRHKAKHAGRRLWSLLQRQVRRCFWQYLCLHCGWAVDAAAAWLCGRCTHENSDYTQCR